MSVVKVPLSLYAIIARVINAVTPIKPKHWVFGSDYGDSYREGAKYLIEYMIANHPDYHCTFITSSKVVAAELKARGIPYAINTTIRAMKIIAKSDVVISSRTINDVLFAYKKFGRRFYYVVHGMPLKIAIEALPKDYVDNYLTPHKRTIKSLMVDLINPPITMEDIGFVGVTSDFLVPYMEKDMGYKTPIKVVGMPRNDIFFDEERIKKENWIKEVAGKFVVLYMPTHRKYGHGDTSPYPFINRPDYQEWMVKNDVVLLVKQHPLMASKTSFANKSEVIRDITKENLDPQVGLYHSDVLITDFSSVWMDYLLLRRPVLFYIYDNFERDDAGCHYDIREDPPGHFCTTEDELFVLIKKCKEDYDSMKPSDRIVSKYHKYVDGLSCKRYFDAIVNDQN